MKLNEQLNRMATLMGINENFGGMGEVAPEPSQPNEILQISKAVEALMLAFHNDKINKQRYDIQMGELTDQLKNYYFNTMDKEGKDDLQIEQELGGLTNTTMKQIIRDIQNKY